MYEDEIDLIKKKSKEKLLTSFKKENLKENYHLEKLKVFSLFVALIIEIWG